MLPPVDFKTCVCQAKRAEVIFLRIWISMTRLPGHGCMEPFKQKFWLICEGDGQTSTMLKFSLIALQGFASHSFDFFRLIFSSVINAQRLSCSWERYRGMAMAGDFMGSSQRREHAKSKCKMMKERCTGIEETFHSNGETRYKVT